MNVHEFYSRLVKISDAYHWNLDSNNHVVATLMSGVDKGFKLNPVTALAHKSGLGLFKNNKKSTVLAGNLLGLRKTFSENVYDATISYHNRGNTQVVRGRIRSVLEV